jgi:hypothetical protein
LALRGQRYTRETPFFETLGALASNQEENQLSRTFKACFDNSAYWRMQFGRLLAARVPRLPVVSTDWTCGVEEGIKGRIGRLDLHIRSADGKPIVALESKVESALREDQIRKYLRHGVEKIVVLTKYPPEVSDRFLRKRNVAAFRWQDIHRLLRQSKPKRHVDRFMLDAFAQYLESLDMAYPDVITKKDLAYMAAALRCVANGSGARPSEGTVPRSGFATASHCLDVLSVIAKKLRDAYPPLEHASQWGPGYTPWHNPRGKLWHVLSVRLVSKRLKSKSSALYLEILIPNDPGHPIWNVEYYYRAEETQSFAKSKINAFCSRQGILQVDGLFQDALENVRKWKVRL